MYNKKNIINNIRIQANKSLIYQTIILINLRAIILIFTLIIVLIKDQKREFRTKNIIALALITITVKVDTKI